MTDFNIAVYKNKVKQYENKYIEYVNALFNSEDGTANSLRIELSDINTELINDIKSFSEIVKNQKNEREQLEQMTDGLKNEYESKKLLENKEEFNYQYYK